MRRWAWQSLFVLAALWFTACDSAPGPAAPAGPQSFLAGTWQGTVTVQVNADIPQRHRRAARRRLGRSKWFR